MKRKCTCFLKMSYTLYRRYTVSPAFNTVKMEWGPRGLGERHQPGEVGVQHERVQPDRATAPVVEQEREGSAVERQPAPATQMHGGKGKKGGRTRGTTQGSCDCTCFLHC